MKALVIDGFQQFLDGMHRLAHGAFPARGRIEAERDAGFRKRCKALLIGRVAVGNFLQVGTSCRVVDKAPERGERRFRAGGNLLVGGDVFFIAPQQEILFGPPVLQELDLQRAQFRLGAAMALDPCAIIIGDTLLDGKDADDKKNARDSDRRHKADPMGQT
jgi:hypothetical protein